jgi:hypothetical protein
MQKISLMVVGVVLGLVLAIVVRKLYGKSKAALQGWVARRKAAALTLEQRVQALEQAEAARVSAIKGIL